MNCISCNALLKEGAKFCTRCGAPQTVATGAPKENVPAINTSSSQDDNIAMVKQKIYWNVQPGEVAKRINEVEFMQYETAQGIIINDGTTAYVKSNGRLVAEIHGGSYDFISPAELDKLLETRVGGAASWCKGAYRFFAKFLLGEKVKDQVAGSDNDLKKLKSLDEVVEYMKRGELFSITLKQDREFQLIMGGMHEGLDEFADFVPMEIRTRYHDIKVGVRAFFQISDFTAFASFYLGDAASVRTNNLAKQLTPIVRSVLQDCLHDVELKDTRLPENLNDKIAARLQNMDFHGVALKNIVEVTTDNQDLERMRALARELYLSEQELDYLHRTNDFKNRLNTVVGEQAITEAQRDLDLFKQLQVINKDQLLAEDELEKFYIVLSREKRIREAQNENEVAAALEEIERTGLLRQEDTEILRFQMNERAYQRGFSVKLMQLKDAVEYEKVRTGGEQEIEMQQFAHELELARTSDKYEEEKFYKELERVEAVRRSEVDFARQKVQLQNEQIEFNYNLAERGQQSQMERLAQMERLDAEMEDRATERRVKEKQQEMDFLLQMQKEKETTERDRIRAHENMSQEQIMAQQVTNLDAEAQAEYARSFSAGKDAEKERQMREEQMRFMNEQMATQQQMSAQNSDNMKEMMSKMMDTVAQMSGNMVQNRNEQKEEYRQQLQREQERHDAHQDRALNYTTRGGQQTVIIPGVNSQQIQQAPAQPAAPKSDGYKVCGRCQKLYAPTERFCADCGCEI